MNTSFKAAALAFTALTTSYSHAAPAIRCLPVNPNGLPDPGTGGRPGDRVHRHHRTARPTSSSGTPQLDVCRAQCRPDGMHWRRTGSRVAARAAAPIGNPKRCNWGRPAISMQPTLFASWKCPPVWTGPMATCMPLATRTFRPTHATLPPWRKLWAKRLAEVDPAHASTYQSRLTDFNARWGKPCSDGTKPWRR